MCQIDLEAKKNGDDVSLMVLKAKLRCSLRTIEQTTLGLDRL
jgi:hypothetical protein